MVAVRAGDAETALTRRDGKHNVVLLFGPDVGLVRERAAGLVKRAVPDLADPFSVVRLDGDDIAADPRRLVDEAGTMGLFGGERVVWVRAGSRNIAPAVEALLAAPVEALVVIEAGDLKRGAPLRALCESDKAALAIPCYADGERDLARLVDAMLSEAGLAIDRDAKDLLVSLIGGDRLASRGEVAKLALYAKGQSRVTLDDVRMIVGDASALALDDVVDVALAGNAAAAAGALAKARAAAMRPDAILGALLRGLFGLHQMALAVEAGSSVDRVIDQQRPAVHFSRKPHLERALRSFPAGQCLRAALLVDEAILACRRTPALGDAIAERVLLQIAGRRRPA
ncbi:DNA polymerase III subunit delta [Aquabacter spiritensis]|uniref:DNA-directed DNA polymerase n=1 Tax=Aquabacter spiritensis TaxID=933073 RepID=A0A4R3LX55_9HYPH|nr:DNA polymerase III subunit delta [Aquabacter spiritensis]TCT05224.1 DNA polymerase III delta subunit [Aquabacter spiritensis]